MIDATEQQIQRPSHDEVQKETYSGKTLKAMAITTKYKVIKYLSPIYIGKDHDFSLLKTEFPPGKKWFKNFHIKVDLGYLGIEKEYDCRCLSIPHKKNKKHALDYTAKERE